MRYDVAYETNFAPCRVHLVRTAETPILAARAVADDYSQTAGMRLLAITKGGPAAARLAEVFAGLPAYLDGKPAGESVFGNVDAGGNGMVLFVSLREY